MQRTYRTLRWILGDQLNEKHSWFGAVDDQVLYIIAELPQETQYVRHHVQKLCAFFAAMELFADRLQSAGHDVLHLTLDDTSRFKDLPALMRHCCEQYQAEELAYQRPDEYRLLQQLRDLAPVFPLRMTECDSEHFLLPFAELEAHFRQGQHQPMEKFYRKMRRRFSCLMDGTDPAGGKWNYDADNRNKLNREDLEDIPAPLLFTTPVSHILKRLRSHDVAHFGKEADPLPWPVTRADSLKLLEFFCTSCLPQFGRFQDALTGKSEFAWSLYHSRLSFALNSKLLGPAEVIDAAIATYLGRQDINLAQIEGFVRQILGWREYIRGIYWQNMPGLESLNHFNATSALPGFFWTGETRMRCMRLAVTQSLEHAYAHHIQRLMVTGNFCLLTGIDPDQVDDWYLGIYLDAIQWVELPNTRGMALFADGGIVGTKPYAAGGNYINKMSDYCGDCYYDVKKKTGESACPLNSLYWRFMVRHRDELQRNHRIRMIYGSWDRMDSEAREAILSKAESVLANIESL